MNPERTVFGRLTIQDDKIDLGRASFKVIIQRLMEQYARKRYDGEKLRVVLEISDEKLGALSIMSREQQLEAEAASLFVPLDEEVFPGVTAARVGQVIDSPEYIAYNHLCEPTNRIGVPDDTIEMVRNAYRVTFPECIEHFPLWRN